MSSFSLVRRACVLCLAPMLLHAQGPARPAAGPPPAIKDNSFLVEEAYNQDPRTVQHISAFSRSTSDRSWSYGFTQEWAFHGQRQQLSVTVPMARVEDDARAPWGMGDVALNYRYQVAGVESGRVAIAPRLSLLLPTGRASAGLGTGAVGVQAMLPASVEVSDAIVMHLNAGVARTGSAAAGTGPAATVNLAQSVIWLATPRVNVLVETAWSRTTTANEAEARSLFVSPGVRWSYDLPRRLQVVPGVAFPIGIGPSAGERMVFLYLSFEHPY